jgi:hypothetical protein
MHTRLRRGSHAGNGGGRTRAMARRCVGWAGPTDVEGNPRKGAGVYIVVGLVRARLGRLVRVVRSDWISWVCAESTPMLSIGVE